MSLNIDKSLWKRVTFSDLVANVNDYFDAKNDGVLPYVAGPHINPGEPTVAGYGSTDDDKFPPTFKRKFRPGDVLLHSRGIEKLAVVDRVGVTGEKLFVLRSKDGHTLSQEFLVWLLLSPAAQAHMRDNFTGSVNKFLNWKPLAAMEFDLPPLDEQKRIADLFWTIEAQRIASYVLLGATAAARRVLIDSQLSVLLAERTVPFEKTWARSPESGWSAAPVAEATGRFVLSLAALGPDGYRLGHYKNVPDTLDFRGFMRRGVRCLPRPAGWRGVLQGLAGQGEMA